MKLGLVKQFVTAWPTEGDCFKNLLPKFSCLSFEKIKASGFDGPQIRKLFPNDHFVVAMPEIQKQS